MAPASIMEHLYAYGGMLQRGGGREWSLSGDLLPHAVGKPNTFVYMMCKGRTRMAEVCARVHTGCAGACAFPSLSVEGAYLRRRAECDSVRVERPGA